MEARNVLLVEDDASHALLVCRSLRDQAGDALGVEHVTTLQAGIERLAGSHLDVVLLDIDLPDSQGIETVVRMRESSPTLPIVVFTEAGDEQTPLAVLAAGAQDHLAKGEISASLLRRSMHYAIERSLVAQLERRLRRVEKMESLGALCAGVGWGFNTLIGTIFDRCDYALASLDRTGHEFRVRSALLEIHRAAFRAAEMSQRLRDYAGIERSASGPMDLGAFVLEASEFLATLVYPDIDVVCDTRGERLLVDATRPELHRLLVSLVVNAAEAIGNARGTIAIGTGSVEVDAAWLADTHGWPDPRPGLHTFLRVADTGRGLVAVDRERIFDPFYTTKFAGRGLGLTGVAGVLRKHRAVVRIDDNRPTGTVFTICFPRTGQCGPRDSRE